MVFLSMPQVAPGTLDNPFPAHIEDLRKYAYGTPAPGLEVRLGILIGIAAVGLLATLALLGLYTEQHRRSRNTVWLFRTVTTERGTWVVSNTKLLMAFTAFFTEILILAFLFEFRSVFVKGKPQTSLGPLWIAYTVPLLFFGLLLSWGSACAYLITPDARRSPFTRPRVVNVFFVGLGGGQCLAHFATLLFAAVYCPKVSKLYERAMAELIVLRLSWDAGTYSPERLESYRTTFDAMRIAYDRYQPVVGFSFGIIALTGGCIFFLNVGYIALILTVRIQIRRNREDWRNNLWTAALGTTVQNNQATDKLDVPATPQLAPPRHTTGLGHLFATLKNYASRSSGERPISAEPGSERARNLAALIRAEQELVMYWAAVGSFGGGGGLIFCAVFVMHVKRTFYPQPWPILEVCYLLPIWGMTIIGLVMILFLIHTAWITLPPKRRPRLDATTRRHDMRPRLVSSFSGEIRVEQVEITVTCAPEEEYISDEQNNSN